MRPGLPPWRKLASQNEKYAYRYQNMTSYHGLTKRVAAPIATSEFEIRYGLFKLTKRSDKLFKCFHTSRSLRTIFCFIIRFALIVYNFCEAKRNSLFRLR